MGLMQRNKGKVFERRVAAELREVIRGERVLIHRSSQAERAYNPDVMMEGDDVPPLARALWLELCDERAPNPRAKLEQGERDVARLGQADRRLVVVVSHRYRARHLDVTMRLDTVLKLCETGEFGRARPERLCVQNALVTMGWQDFLCWFRL